MPRERETMTEWADRLGFDLVKIESEDDEPAYQLIDKRTGIAMRGVFEDWRDVAEELRAREE